MENDLVEAIIQLPNNLFYNTGITIHIWVLSNKKTDKSKGDTIIEASLLFGKFRKNLGEKTANYLKII